MAVAVSKAEKKSFKDELHPTFERRKWAFDRAMWCVMAALILAALLGFFGSGIFSRTTVSESYQGGAVELAHPRFARFHVPENMRLDVHAPDATGESLKVTLSSALAEQIDVTSVSPPPDSVTFGPDGQTYEWQVEDWSQPVGPSFAYEPDDWGRVKGQMSVQAGDAAEVTLGVTQWVFA